MAGRTLFSSYQWITHFLRLFHRFKLALGPSLLVQRAAEGNVARQAKTYAVCWRDMSQWLTQNVLTSCINLNEVLNQQFIIKSWYWCMLSASWDIQCGLSSRYLLRKKRRLAFLGSHSTLLYLTKQLCELGWQRVKDSPRKWLGIVTITWVFPNLWCKSKPFHFPFCASLSTKNLNSPVVFVSKLIFTNNPISHSL